MGGEAFWWHFAWEFCWQEENVCFGFLREGRRLFLRNWHLVPGFAWGLEWYFFAEIGSGNGFGKDKKKEPKVVLCLRKLSSVPFF